MNKKTIITALLALVSMTGWAQNTVKGHVVNERGEGVEYVSIGIEEDSVGVISDAQGHFTLTICLVDMKGVKEAKWNPRTCEVTVIYDANVTSVRNIKHFMA